MAASQQPQRRPRASRALAAAVALAVVTIGLHLVPAFVSAGQHEAGRRSLLTGAAAALVAGAGAMEAQAQLSPSLPGTGQKRKKGKEYTDEEMTAIIRKRLGGNLGKIMNIKDKCLYVIENDPGLFANLGTDGVIVWDENEPCGKGESYIVGAGVGDLLRMTAANGPPKHKFIAGTFEYPYVKEYQKQIGKCVNTPQDGEDFISWEIANKPRGGICD